jgi:flagellar basal-body rod protein FlgG
VAIDGPGFFVVTDPATGQNEYTRAGNFSVNSNNQLVIGSAQTGRQLFPSIQVPQDAMNITIGPDGTVQVQQSQNAQLQIIGQIQTARFFNPQGLLKMGENLFMDTLSSGPPQIATPGTVGLGTLIQNSLELSNVDPVNELVDLITTQRSFELNSQVVQAGDQMLQLMANLRRF